MGRPSLTTADEAWLTARAHTVGREAAPDAAVARGGAVHERVLEEHGAAGAEAAVVAQLDGEGVVRGQRRKVHVAGGAPEEAARVALDVEAR